MFDPNDPTQSQPFPSLWEDDFNARHQAAMMGVQAPGSAPAPDDSAAEPPIAPPSSQPPEHPAPDAPDPQVEDWLKTKRAEYEKFGAAPEDVDKWLATKRAEYTHFRKQSSAPAPGPMSMSHPRTDEARIAQFGAPTGDELPAGALDLSPDDAAQIEIDPAAAASPGAQAAMAPPELAGAPTLAAPPSLEPDAVNGGFTPEQTYAQQQVDATGAPFAGQTSGTPEMPDEYLDNGELAAKRADEPEEKYFERVRAAEAAKRHEFVAQALDASRKKQEDAQRGYDTWVAAQRQAQVDRDRLDFDAKNLAQQDPEHWMKSRSMPQTIAAFSAAILGGLTSSSTGGRNMGLEMIDKAIDDDNNAQAANIAGKRQDLTRRGNSIAERLQSAGDQYHAGELYRSAVYEAAINDLQTKMQDFDPAGTTANELEGHIREMRAAQAANYDKYQQQRFKNRLEVEKAYQEQQKIDETNRHNLATEKPKGTGTNAGVGSNTNPNYTVATGFFDPFTNEPIFGKREIGGKGEGTKERQETEVSIATYAHVQDYWSKLRTIGQKIENHKSLGESVWSKLKSTDGAEYDAAKHALVVYLTKELGDKLTQGQLDAQSHRIPDRASLLESRDPGKQIADAQEDADRDFMRDMNLKGINGQPIVENARKMRAPAPIPRAEDELGAAQQALAAARNPTETRDAKAALGAAKERITAEHENEAKGKKALESVDMHGPRRVLPTDGLPDGIATEVAARNEAADTYNQQLQQFHDKSSADPTKGLSGKGDIGKAKDDHDKEVASHALKISQSRKAYEQADRDLADHLVDTLSSTGFGGIPQNKVAEIAAKFAPNIDPTKFSDDAGGQVELGKFAAQLHKLDPYKRRKLVEFYVGSAKESK